MSDEFYAGPRDLAHAQAVTDAWDALVRDDSQLASWAYVTCPEPMTERALGAFAEWAREATEPVA